MPQVIRVNDLVEVEIYCFAECEMRREVPRVFKWHLPAVARKPRHDHISFLIRGNSAALSLPRAHNIASIPTAASTTALCVEDDKATKEEVKDGEDEVNCDFTPILCGS